MGPPQARVFHALVQFLEKEDTMKILVGYDGSGVAEDVLKLAHKHAKAFKYVILKAPCPVVSVK